VVSFSGTAHVMLNPRDGSGITDHYVCRGCYEAKLAPLFESEEDSDEE